MSKANGLNEDEWALWSDWMHAQRLLAQSLDRQLQAEFGISKAEFSVLVTLHQSATPEMRVLEIAESLGWEKSRVAHLLTRMEARALLRRSESASNGRRTGVGLTNEGRCLTLSAIKQHGKNVRRLFLDGLSVDQAAVIRAWSRKVIDQLT